MAIATLTIDITARLANIERDMTRLNRHMADSARQIESAFTGVGDSIKGLFAGLLAYVSVDFLSGAITQVLDAQDAIVDLTKSTALSVEVISGLGFAANTTGSNLEDIAKSIAKLQQNIGKDPEKYKELGINARDGYEAFKQLADIFVSIEDPAERAAVAAEALGKAWMGAAPGLSEGSKGFDDLVQKGTEVSKVTTETAERAAELNAKLDVLKARASGVSTELVNALVPSLDRTAAQMESLAAQGKGLEAVLVGLIGLMKLPAQLVFGEVDMSKSAQIKDLEKNLASLEQKAKQATGQGGLIGNLIYGKPGEFDQQIAVTKNQIEALKKFGKDPVVEEPTKLTPPSSAAIKKFVGGGGGGGRGGGGGSKSAKAVDDGARLVEQLREQVRGTQDLTEVEKLELHIADGKYKTATAGNLEIARGYAQTLDLIKQQKAESEKEIDLIKERARVQQETASEVKRIFDATRTPAEALNIEVERLLTLLNSGALGDGAEGLELFGRAAAKAGEQMQELEARMVDTVDQSNSFAKSAAKNIQSAFADFLFDPFEKGTQGMLQSFGETIRRMIANAVAADLGKRLFGDLGGKGGLGGLVGEGLSWLSGLLPSFDVGTPYVQRDMIALVHKGEKIIPAAENRPGNSGNNVSVIINMGSGSSPAEVRRAGGAVAREVIGAISSSRRYA